MSHKSKSLISGFLCFILIIFSFQVQPVSAISSDSVTFILLSKYSASVDIGNELYILAITSNGKQPTWKSSNSSIASVNTYGKVLAKKAGSVTLTAKIKNAEASCKVKVNKTNITISKTSASIERGEKLKLSATASTKSEIKWKSSKSSVAAIDDSGNVTAMKPGETTITASADGSSVTCKIKVKSPTIQLDKTNIKLYRSQKVQLSATVSSGISPNWKTNKKSVAVVDEYGTVTAVKNGIASITATVDGVSKICKVTVEKPAITLSAVEINLKKGTTLAISAAVSSGNPPAWSSSNSNVATVDGAGKITALKKGTAYIYAAEDGTKVRCIVHVLE